MAHEHSPGSWPTGFGSTAPPRGAAAGSGRGWLVAVAILVLAWGCGNGVPDIGDAWRELRDPEQATNVDNLERRLLLARMVLEESTLPSGARARFPLGFAHLVELLSAQSGSEAPYAEFDRLVQAITAGRTTRAEIRLDVTRVEAASRVALEQLVEITAPDAPGERSLWVPERAPGFPKPLAAGDLRIEIARVPDVWSRLPIERVRLGVVGPAGFVATIPAGVARLRIIYGEGGGFSMPLRTGRFGLPLWIGTEPDVQFVLGESVLEVVASAPAEVQVRGPSVVRPGEVFALELRRTDRLGNEVGESVRPAMELWSGGRIERRFPAGEGTRLTVGGMSRAESGVVRYRVESADGLVGWSPPILVREQGAKLLWGDPAAAVGSCSGTARPLDFERCVVWAGCGSTGLESVTCEGSSGSQVLWMDRVRGEGSMRDVQEWQSDIGRFGVADPDRGTLAFATLELLETGLVSTGTEWTGPDVALLGSETPLGGDWPGHVVAALGSLTAFWSAPGGVDREDRGLSNGYATAGPRLVLDCRGPESTTDSARCGVHGTAPLWRIAALVPDEAGESPVGLPGARTWRLVQEFRPLETNQRSLLILAWSPRSDGPRRPTYVEGELSVAGGAIPSASLFGDTLETTALGRDGLLFRQLAPPTRGGLLADVGGDLEEDRRLRLVLRRSGREETVDFLAGEVPFQRPLESGWIEADWVDERPILDFDARFPDLDPSEAARAIVLVQQVDGSVAVARFRSP